MTELSKKYLLVYIGARPKKCFRITEKWLNKVGFPEGIICLGENQNERINIVLKLKKRYVFKAGIGDRWDDNELHLALGCMSIILKEYEPDWDTVNKHID